MSPSVVVHAMNCTPRSLAMSISSGTPGMRLRRITSFIIRVPKPQKWKRDKGNVSAPPLLRNPNARRSQSAALLDTRSEEHTSELQSPCNLVCRLLLEKKKQTTKTDAK